MNIKKRIKSEIEIFLEKRIHRKKLQAEIKKFKDPRRVAIYSSVQLTPEQKKQIDDLFSVHYGMKVPYTWHRHFTAFTGRFDPRYIPETLFIPEYERYMNPDQNYINVFADKNVLAMIAKGVGIRMPETVASCANGVLRDGNYHIVRWDNLVDLLPEETCFAKPTIDSDSGKGCMLIDKKQTDLISTLETMGNNFVVQERIVCSDSIQKINPSSVNTFRVMTYFWDGKIQCAPVIMRIGRNGSFLDNAHAGGLFIAVNQDGTLHKTAFTEFKISFTEHPDTHVVFDGYKIDNFDKVIESAKRIHAAMPQLGVVNWDFTIDKDETPVLIEANTSGGSIWLFQMAWGCGVFEENTVGILEWIKEKKKNEHFAYHLSDK